MAIPEQRLYEFLTENDWLDHEKESENHYGVYSVSVEKEYGKFLIALIFGMKEDSLVALVLNLCDPNWKNDDVTYEIGLLISDLYGDKPTSIVGASIPLKGKLKRLFLNSGYLPRKEAKRIEAIDQMVFLFGITSEEFNVARLKKSVG